MNPDPRRTGESSRCWWAGEQPDYQHYHDHEWGRPVADDRRLFEKLCLEGFQAGLSWLTILRKRGNFRAAFAGFDFEQVARFGARDVQRLLGNAGIVRHRGKVEATINNAQRACELVEREGSLASFLWGFEPGPSSRPVRVTRGTLEQIGATAESTAMSKALKKLGWRFVGPTTCYAFMQSMGMVNDHLENCPARSLVEREREAFRRPD